MLAGKDSPFLSTVKVFVKSKPSSKMTRRDWLKLCECGGAWILGTGGGCCGTRCSNAVWEQWQTLSSSDQVSQIIMRCNCTNEGFLSAICVTSRHIFFYKFGFVFKMSLIKDSKHRLMSLATFFLLLFSQFRKCWEQVHVCISIRTRAR